MKIGMVIEILVIDDLVIYRNEQNSDGSLSARMLLSCNEKYFALLFRSLELDMALGEAVWSLLMQLPTNPVLKQRILALSSDSIPDWQALFDDRSAYKLMYSLQILQTCLVAHDIMFTMPPSPSPSTYFDSKSSGTVRVDGHGTVSTSFASSPSSSDAGGDNDAVTTTPVAFNTV